MKAIVQDTYGTSDVLAVAEIAKPRPENHDVLVRVRAAGVDRGVWHLMTGSPYVVRAFAGGLKKPAQRVRGMDVAGRVEAIGSKVAELRVGDEVFGTCQGSFAQYACVHQDNCALKPTNLTFEQAAAVPMCSLTALQAFRDEGRIQAGQSALIIGAAGGVGTFAVQLAKAFGAEVTGVCSTGKPDMVRAIGADYVVDYTREDFATMEHRYDLILDIAGNRPLSQLRGALVPRGTLVLVGGENGGRWLGGLDRQLLALAMSPFVSHRLRGLLATQRKQDLHLLRDLIEAGKVTPVLDKTYPLNEAAAATRYLETGRVRGKVVLVA